jgi:hypothetical protein
MEHAKQLVFGAKMLQVEGSVIQHGPNMSAKFLVAFLFADIALSQPIVSGTGPAVWTV